MDAGKQAENNDLQTVLDWLESESSPAEGQTAPYIPKGIDRMSSADRADVLDWLGIEDPSSAHSEPKPDLQAVAWLAQVRAVLAGQDVATAKLGKIREIPLGGSALTVIKSSARTCLKGYRSLPVGVQVALPVTAMAAPALGGAGVGIAAFGGAIGLPALLVLFLGVAGVSSLIGDLLGENDESAAFARSILAVLATDAALMRMRAEARAAAAKQVVEPRRRSMPEDQAACLKRWLSLSPLEFEQHVMGLVAESGRLAWVTPAGSDGGIDGIVKDGDRLILVQCKRYAVDHPVGRPAIQQFKGIIEENGADLGVFVTSSTFTAQAAESAAKSERLLLVDGDHLYQWQRDGVTL